VTTLRDVQEADLPIFFEQQRDSEANYMAAFTSFLGHVRSTEGLSKITSLRVLEKGGFKLSGYKKDFAEGRG
jgi:hypothetical protein